MLGAYVSALQLFALGILKEMPLGHPQQLNVFCRQMATAQCCLLVDHIRSERCAPCRRYYAVPWLQVHNATSRISGHTTYRLMLDLIEKRAANIYTIYGDKLAPLILPDKHVFNEPLPMGANIGGVWPAFRYDTTTA